MKYRNLTSLDVPYPFKFMMWFFLNISVYALIATSDSITVFASTFKRNWENSKGEERFIVLKNPFTPAAALPFLIVRALFDHFLSVQRTSSGRSFRVGLLLRSCLNLPSFQNPSVSTYSQRTVSPNKEVKVDSAFLSLPEECCVTSSSHHGFGAESTVAQIVFPLCII